jgi:ABC-type glycerol-3-phosphate transport system substrate-binding protein
MTVMGFWATTAYRQGIGGNFAWDVLRFPFGGGGKRAVSAAGANGSIARPTKHPEAAWQSTKHYYSTESLNTVIAEPLRSIPGRKSSAARWEQVAAAGASRRSTRGPSRGRCRTPSRRRTCPTTGRRGT